MNVFWRIFLHFCKKKKRIWIRVPIVPGFNDTVEEMNTIREFLTKFGYPERVELLPYHRMGESKAKALKMEYVSFETPDKERISFLQKIIQK